MFGPTPVLIALLIIALILIGLVVIKPSITVTRGGKILAFVSFFVFPVLGGTFGLSVHVERSKNTQFCTSCHVMKDYGKSLLIDDPSYIPAGHFQNNRVPRDSACYTCHTDYTMYGGFRSKLRGLSHIYYQYLGTIPDKIELRTPYNNRECLHCHQGARSFEEGATHNMEEGRLALMKSNRLSCMTSECHSSTHDIKNLSNLTFWSPDKAKTDDGSAANDAAGSNK
jgi:cytochrome c-type protein NapC